MNRIVLSCFFVLLSSLEIDRLSAEAAQADQSYSKGPSEFTKKMHDQVLRKLPFEDLEDFKLAQKGLLAKEEKLIIRNENGKVIWDMTQFGYLDDPRPDTVNPSLWRQAKLNALHGLFKVTDRIFQVRGYDLANMTLIEGDTGWIIIDPLTSTETVQAAMALVEKHFGERPVKAILSTHSHADHFGGARALADEKDLEEGRVRYVVPEGFVEEAASENVIAGNAMGRRAAYMFGNFLPRTPDGAIDSGLGKGVVIGNITLLSPTDTITETGQKLVLDGIEFEFQLTPGAEAPSEFMFYLPQMKALCVAEEVNAVMHNLYTPRGAKTRDALIWVRHLNDTIEMFGERANIVFGSHHWPRWGREEGFEYIAKQRDMYRYIHDQTVRLMNHGLTPTEISNKLELPLSLGNEFYNRDYYGTTSHNSRAVYNFYLGFFDGNPAHLNPYEPKKTAVKYLELAGGEKNLISAAERALKGGDYRWAAELLNYLVFAKPDNEQGRFLLADAYEQLGYQSESGPWRNFYLAGARELRGGVVKPTETRRVSKDLIASVPTEMFLDFLGVRFNPQDADDLDITLNLKFTDTEENFVLRLKNSVLNNISNKIADDPNAEMTMTRKVFDLIALRETNMAIEIAKGNIKIGGNPLAVLNIFRRLDNYDPFFNIVTP